MNLLTYGDLVTKLGNDLDITDEAFISQTELLGYINEAIDDAQSAIHNLNAEDKYFLVPSAFNWVSGQSDYSLPANCYANKMRQIFYNNGDQQYEIDRIKNLRETNFFQPGDRYRYILINPTAGVAPVARFYPPPNETSTNAVLWYIREMNKLTTGNASTNLSEVYECQNFVFAHAKYSVMKKTRRADLIAAAKVDRDEQYTNMLSNLQQMVLDENTLIQQDLTFYECGPYYWGRGK